MFRILFFMSIFLSLNTVLATPAPYDISPMNRLNEVIQQYINCSTGEVVVRIGTSEDVAQSFEREFIQEDDHKRKKNQACMKIVRKMICKADGSSEEMNAVEFYHNVSQDFENKREALQAEHDNYWKKKLAFQAMAVISAAAIGIGIKEQKTSLAPYLMGLGAISGTASCVGLYSIYGKQDLLKKHIAQVDTMKKAWDNQLSTNEA